MDYFKFEIFRLKNISSSLQKITINAMYVFYALPARLSGVSLGSSYRRKVLYEISDLEKDNPV